MHFAAALANPIATPTVRIASGGSTIEAPRSWTKEDKTLFASLPPEIAAAVAKREQNRETVLRRSQNETAELRNELKRLKADAATKSADRKEDDNAHERGSVQQDG